MYSSGRSDLMAKISRIEPKIPALKKRAKVAAYARVSMEIQIALHGNVECFLDFKGGFYI